MIQAIALGAITGYQRYVSPHKGWRCAYAARSGRSSCSGFARRAIEERGVRVGLRLLVRRLACCRSAARRSVTEDGSARPDRPASRPRRTDACHPCGPPDASDAANVACVALDLAPLSCW